MSLVCTVCGYAIGETKTPLEPSGVNPRRHMQCPIVEHATPHAAQLRSIADYLDAHGRPDMAHECRQAAECFTSSPSRRPSPALPPERSPSE